VISQIGPGLTALEPHPIRHAEAHRGQSLANLGPGVSASSPGRTHRRAGRRATAGTDRRGRRRRHMPASASGPGRWRSGRAGHIAQGVGRRAPRAGDAPHHARLARRGLRLPLLSSRPPGRWPTAGDAAPSPVRRPGCRSSRASIVGRRVAPSVEALRHASCRLANWPR
jgi:hypothetical protein